MMGFKVCLCSPVSGEQSAHSAAVSHVNVSPRLMSYLPCHLCRGWPEAEASGRVLLLLHALDPGAEVEFDMEALLRGQVLEQTIDGVKTQRFCNF